MLFTLAACSFVFSAVQVCVTSYTVTFLTHDLRWTLVAAGSALAVAQVAGVVGRIVWGIVADRSGDARPILLALAVAMALCGVGAAALAPTSAPAAVIALLAVYGATAIGWNGVFLATIARVVPIGDAAQATSGSLFFTYFGVVIGPPLFGLIASWRGGLGDGVRAARAAAGLVDLAALALAQRRARGAAPARKAASRPTSGLRRHGSRRDGLGLRRAASAAAGPGRAGRRTESSDERHRIADALDDVALPRSRCTRCTGSISAM